MSVVGAVLGRPSCRQVPRGDICRRPLCTFCIHFSNKLCLLACPGLHAAGPHLAAPTSAICFYLWYNECPWKTCRYVPLGLIWHPGQYPTDAAGYDDITRTIRTWVLARLAWMEGQFRQVGCLSSLYQDSGSGSDSSEGRSQTLTLSRGRQPACACMLAVCGNSPFKKAPFTLERMLGALPSLIPGVLSKPPVALAR